MSMILGLTALTDATIARLLADPPLVWRIVAPDDPEAYEQARAEADRPPSFLGRLLGAKPATPKTGARDFSPFVLGPGEGADVDLDKAWHGIHYLLTGTADGGVFPASFLLLGGREVGDIDVGYGPARVMTAEETRDAHEMLSSLSDDALRARFDPAQMMRRQIYPEIWDRDPGDDDTLGYVMENVADLRQFLAAAARDGLGVMITVT